MSEPVHLVIRAATLQGEYLSDIGFTRLPDGTYRAHINDMHRKYGGSWLGRMEQRYEGQATVEVAQRKEVSSMSKYDSFQTTLTEAEPLVAALQALGYPVEIHKDGAPLFGFHGDERQERAHLVIRRQCLDAASNDIGFVRGSDGRFQAILSEYDRSIGFDQRWLGRVHQRYKEELTLAMARKKGYIFRGREVIQTERGEQVKLLFATR